MFRKDEGQKRYQLGIAYARNEYYKKKKIIPLYTVQV